MHKDGRGCKNMINHENYGDMMNMMKKGGNRCNMMENSDI